MDETRRRNLERLLRPACVAFVGGAAAAFAAGRCAELGYQGDIWLVNPRHREIEGRRCYPSVRDLPRAPDATFVAVPAATTIEVVAELAALGAGAAVCHASGFSEVGAAGRALEEELVNAAGALALVGPNCLGVFNNLDRVCLGLGGSPPPGLGRGPAVISQSGTIPTIMDWNRRSLEFAFVASIGNSPVIHASDLIEVLADDPRITAIAVHVEAIADTPAFVRAAEVARERDVPVVVLKTGRTVPGAVLAQSHTGALVGDDAVYDALFERAGVMRVDSVARLVEALKLFTVSAAPTGPRLAVFMPSGAEASMCADLIHDSVLELPPPNPTQAERLREQLPVFANVSNPLDYHNHIWGNREAQSRVMHTLVREGYDLAVLVIDFPNDAIEPTEWDVAIDALLDVHARVDIPMVVVSCMPEGLPEPVRRKLMEADIAPLQGLEDALHVIALALVQRRRQRALSAIGGASAPLVPAKSTSARQLQDEWESKKLLAEHGLAAPPGRKVGREGLVRAARDVGFPVVLKTLSPVFAHKTEVGAVALSLIDESEALAAARDMQERLGAKTFLVERMMSSPVAELIVGVKSEPPLGIALVLGAGGELVELIEERALLLLPVEREEVRRALMALRTWRLLEGFRGRPPGDTEAVIDAVMAVARAAEALVDSVAEIDVNPLLVMPRGEGAVAGDALVTRFEA